MRFSGNFIHAQCDFSLKYRIPGLELFFHDFSRIYVNFQGYTQIPWLFKVKWFSMIFNDCWEPWIDVIKPFGSGMLLAWWSLLARWPCGAYGGHTWYLHYYKWYALAQFSLYMALLFWGGGGGWWYIYMSGFGGTFHR